MMADRQCALCSGTGWDIEFRLAIGTVVRCRTCALVSMVDADGALVRCSYDEGYYQQPDASRPGYEDYFGGEAASRREVASALADTVRALAGNARHALDLGCGGGFLVEELTRRGIDCTGLDGSRYALERAREHPARGRYLHGGIGGPGLAGEAPFDVITMIDVIEHLPDPVAALRWAAGLVAPGGIIVLLTPRYGGRLLREQGAAYVHFHTDHMYYFTEDTLRACVGRALGHGDMDVDDVLAVVQKMDVPVPATMAHKYGFDRESMLAVVRF